MILGALHKKSHSTCLPESRFGIGTKGLGTGGPVPSHHHSRCFTRLRRVQHDICERPVLAYTLGSSSLGQPVVQQALAGQSGAIRTDDFDGLDVAAGFAEVPGVEWGLVTEESWANVRAGSSNSQRALLLLLALGVVIPAFLVAFGLRRIMRPVKAIADGAKRISAGDFEHPIEAGTGDEIQDLAQRFNAMATALKESYSGLEQKVVDRTQEFTESEERYRTLFEDSRNAIFISSGDGGVVDANQAALELFGFAKDEAIGSDIGERFVDPADRERFRAEVGRIGSVREFEVRLSKQDGTEIDCLLSATRQLDAEGKSLGVMGIIHDISERKQAEEQGRDLVVLQERNRVAREIHDTLAQGFTGIVLQLEAAEQALDGGHPEVGGHLDRARRLARESLQEARRSVWDLLPKSLEGRSLDAALQEAVDTWADDGQESASFTFSGNGRELPSAVQTALLRICQESLTNVRRHARATKVTVELTADPEAAGLRIRDDGVGFDPTKPIDGDGPGGFGLAGMKQRASLLGGAVSVHSEIGKGTLVEARLPLE